MALGKPLVLGYFVHLFFKDKYNRSYLWIGIIGLGLTIWVLYESGNMMF